MNPASVFATLLVSLLGIGTLGATTDAFTVWTAETARRQALIERPAQLPEVSLQDQTARVFEMAEYREGLVLLDFIYTRCATVCQALGVSFNRLQAEIRKRGWQHRVALLSVSFDGNTDLPAMLDAYLTRFDADAGIWRSARVTDAHELAGWLEQWDVTVIPDGYGGYVHNAAIYLVENGVLRAVFDLEDIAGPVDALAVALGESDAH
jgi:protein SCO1/2